MCCWVGHCNILLVPVTVTSVLLLDYCAAHPSGYEQPLTAKQDCEKSAYSSTSGQIDDYQTEEIHVSSKSAIKTYSVKNESCGSCVYLLLLALGTLDNSGPRTFTIFRRMNLDAAQSSTSTSSLRTWL